MIALGLLFAALARLPGPACSGEPACPGEPVCPGATGSAGAEWSQFRGPGGSGVCADAVALPETLDPELNLLWRTPVDPGHASPVVHGGRVFVTGARGAEAGGEQLVTACFDLATGAALWSQALEAPQAQRHHEVNSAASSTPAADADSVYVYFGPIGVVCYDRDGNERWRRAHELPENTFGTATSPILAGGRLVLNRDSNRGGWTEVLEPRTGAVVWRTEREGDKSGWSTPILRDRTSGPEILVSTPRSLRAYALASGRELWSAPGLTDEPCTTPSVGAGLVFVSSYNMKTNPEVEGLPEFAALVADLDRDGDGVIDRGEAEANRSVLSRHDAQGEGDHPLRIFFKWLDADGSGELDAGEWKRLEDWVDSFDFANGLLALRPGDAERPAEVVWQHTRGVPECPSPLFVPGRGGEADTVFMVKNGGIATCLDAASGELVWRARLGAPGPYYASPVAGDGKLYTASAGGVVTVLRSGPTDELERLSQVELGERIMATPALSGGRVLVRTADSLLAFGRRAD